MMDNLNGSPLIESDYGGFTPTNIGKQESLITVEEMLEIET